MGATEYQLKQAAIDALHRMMQPRARATRVKGELALGILEEMREARVDRQPPEWVQEMIAQEALENERERRNKGKDF